MTMLRYSATVPVTARGVTGLVVLVGYCGADGSSRGSIGPRLHGGTRCGGPEGRPQTALGPSSAGVITLGFTGRVPFKVGGQVTVYGVARVS